jgi:hypothetical protein
MQADMMAYICKDVDQLSEQIAVAESVLQCHMKRLVHSWAACHSTSIFLLCHVQTGGEAEGMLPHQDWRGGKLLIRPIDA